MDAGISAISFSVMPRRNKVVMRVTNVKAGHNVKGERTRARIAMRSWPLRESTAVLHESCGLQDRRQLRRDLVASNEATSRNALTLADLDMNASSYRHMSMKHPDGPTALP
jgi:hypothetical protein